MLAGPQRLPHAIGPPVERGITGHRLAVDLDDTVHEIADPVFGQAGAGVEAALVLAIGCEGRIGNLNDQRGSRWMIGQVVAGTAGDDGEIRLGLGLLVERDGRLDADVPEAGERLPQRSSALSPVSSIPISISRPYSTRVQRRIWTGVSLIALG